MNLTEEKVRNNLEVIGTADNFLNRTLIKEPVRSAFNMWDFMKLKSSVKQKTLSVRRSDSLRN